MEETFLAAAKDNWLRRYAAALASVIFLTGVRFIASHWLGDRAPFSIYIIAVAFSAWYGGFGPAILALGAGLVCSLSLFAASNVFADRTRLSAMVLALVTGLMVAALGAARRRAERLASSRKEELDQVLRQMNDAFFVLDRRWRVLYCNDQAARWLERSSSELIGQSIWQLWPVRIEPAAQQRLLDVVERGESTSLEVPHERPDRWGEIHASPSHQGVALVVSDISSRKASERQIAQALTNERVARAEAEKANRMKDEFLATLSHELRTPLNSILGWSQLLNVDTSPPDELKQGIAAIERNARAQAQLIEDLLDMSRITSGRLKLDISAVNLIDVVNAALEAAAPAANAKRLKLHRDWPADVPLINGDGARLQQVVWNLLTNAVKFTPPDGTIAISLIPDGDALQLRICDDGEGIDPEFMSQIFGRFQQADGSTTRRHGGLGLGLAIVRQLTELHGGTISASSEGRGKGSTFTVRLPLPRNVAPRSRPTIESNGRANLSGITVLVVDDEPDARDLVTRVLMAANADVMVVGSAADAFDALQERRPHVLVSDIAMPGEDGFGLIERVRRLPHEQGGAVPALALTALARPEDQAKALASGFQEHVPKPIDAQRLVRAIAVLVAANRVNN